MPVRMRRLKGGRVRVSTPGGVKAKATTMAKAKRQANLLRAVEHGWKPTGRKARDVRRRVKRSDLSSHTDPVAQKALGKIYKH